MGIKFTTKSKLKKIKIKTKQNCDVIIIHQSLLQYQKSSKKICVFIKITILKI